MLSTHLLFLKAVTVRKVEKNTNQLVFVRAGNTKVHAAVVDEAKVHVVVVDEEESEVSEVHAQAVVEAEVEVAQAVVEAGPGPELHCVMDNTNVHRVF